MLLLGIPALFTYSKCCCFFIFRKCWHYKLCLSSLKFSVSKNAYSMITIDRSYKIPKFCNAILFFSSPELKAHVSFSDHLLYFVHLSVCPSICLLKLFTFSFFSQNNWANFNQSWHKTTLGDGNSSFFQMKGHAFF